MVKLCPGKGGYWEETRRRFIGYKCRYCWDRERGYDGHNWRPIRGVRYPKLDEWDAKQGVLPLGIKRVRIKCELCGRRMMAAYKVCDDGCCLYYFVPPHKPKGWWRQRRKVTRDKRGAKLSCSRTRVRK